MQFQKSNESSVEKVWMTRYNNTGNALIAGQPIEFTAGAVGVAGLEVRGVTAVINPTTGIAAQLAGVATAAVAATTRFTAQVYGACDVRVDSTITAGIAAIASSVSATQFATTAIRTTTTTAEYANALIGVVAEATNATTHIVLLRML